MRRISKREARRLFVEGKAIYLCPCKLRPGHPFNQAALIYGSEYLRKAETYQNHSTLWKGTIERTAWDLMYADWAYYNATWEAGYYAHYYVD